jgi:CBS domain-containing protein
MDLARNLKIESVSRLHPTPPWHVSPADSVAVALQLMREKSQGCILICENKALMGIFTERDLIRRVLAPGKSLASPIADHMTAKPVTVQLKDPISMAIRRMEEGGYRHLPVVVDNEAVGVLSVKRIVHYLVEHFPGTVYNLPPDPSAVQQEREGA